MVHTNSQTQQPVLSETLLQVRQLRTVFPGHDGLLNLVDDVSLSVSAGETLAVVGESGSGKTMTFLSVLGLVPKPGRVVSGEVIFGDQNLLEMAPAQLRKIRGDSIAMVFQDPLTALNPVFTVGAQLMEVIQAHRTIGNSQARKLAIQTLERVHIPDAHRRIDDYPHEFSGGMRQRVLIAMAIVLKPRVLIADEPTTALDVTIQAQILELLVELKNELGMGTVLITHDLGLVGTYADRVAVMYAGKVVEAFPVDDHFGESLHPYTHALFNSIPRLDIPPGSKLVAIDGQPPNAADLPAGCAFESRCSIGKGREDCTSRSPALTHTRTADHQSACFHWQALHHTRTAS